jgi:hypothetical protein
MRRPSLSFLAMVCGPILGITVVCAVGTPHRQGTNLIMGGWTVGSGGCCVATARDLSCSGGEFGGITPCTGGTTNVCFNVPGSGTCQGSGHSNNCEWNTATYGEAPPNNPCDDSIDTECSSDPV